MSYTDTVLDQAQQALQEGRRSDAYQIAKPIADAEPNNPRVWGILADAVENPQEADYYRTRASHLATPAPATPTTITVSSSSLKAPAAGGAVIGGAALIMLGSLLPWGVVRGGFIQQSMSGTDGDGILTLIGGGFLLIAGIGLLIKGNRFSRFMAVLISVVIGVIAFIDMQNINNADERRAAIDRALGGGGSSDFIVTSVGIGLYLILIGVVVAFIGTSLNLKPKK